MLKIVNNLVLTFNEFRMLKQVLVLLLIGSSQCIQQFWNTKCSLVNTKRFKKFSAADFPFNQTFYVIYSHRPSYSMFDNYFFFMTSLTIVKSHFLKCIPDSSNCLQMESSCTVSDEEDYDYNILTVQVEKQTVTKFKKFKPNKNFPFLCNKTICLTDFQFVDYNNQLVVIFGCSGISFGTMVLVNSQNVTEKTIELLKKSEKILDMNFNIKPGLRFELDLRSCDKYQRAFVGHVNVENDSYQILVITCVSLAFFGLILYKVIVMVNKNAQ